MEFVKVALLCSSLRPIVQASKDCALDRNEFNKYPFVIKLFMEQTVGHGLLVTANRVISAYQPLADVFDNQEKLMPRLEFIGQVLGANERVLCTVSRKADEAAIKSGTNRNIIFWRLKKGFEVTENIPFLFTQIEEFSQAEFVKNIEAAKEGESCVLPRFEDRRREAKLRVDSLRDLNALNDEERKIHCMNDPICLGQSRSDELVALDESQLPTEFLWVEGAAIICRGHPLGFLSSVMQTGQMIIQTLTFSVDLLLRYAGEEWSIRKTTATNRNTLGRMKTISGGSIIRGSTTSQSATRFEHPQVESTAKGTKAKVTFSSKIPEAPTQTATTTTSKPTTLFLRTKPQHARPQGNRNKSSKTSSVTLYIIAAKLGFLKYTLRL